MTETDWEEVLVVWTDYLAILLRQWVDQGNQPTAAALVLVEQENCAKAAALFDGVACGVGPARDGRQGIVVPRSELGRLVDDESAATAQSWAGMPLVYVRGKSCLTREVGFGPRRDLN
jgi:hypothetical protein